MEPFELFHLNDDCLRDLFSRLPSIDLCAVKKTCQRFETIADEVAKKRFKDIYECHPNLASLQEHTTILESFGKFVLIMSLKPSPPAVRYGPDIKAHQVISLLHYCKSLVGLYLTGMNLKNVGRFLMFGNLKLLELIRCYDMQNGQYFAPIISVCKRLEVFACFREELYISSGGQQIMMPPRLYRILPTIKHLTTTCYSPGNMHLYLPTADDIAQLYTLEFTDDSGRLASHIDFLAHINPSLVNLVLNMPARTEDFPKIAKSLHIWSNLISYDIITGFQLPDKICELFSSLNYLGRSETPREYLVYSFGRETACPRYIYRYKWIRDAQLFRVGSDEESRFGEFRVWKEKMKRLHINK